MELRHLKYFVAVAEELHFGRAAARLHIAQPPLSQQIKALETELGVTLLNRTKRNVQLSEPGRLFLEEARATLRRAEQAEQVAREAARGIRGCIHVGYVTSASYSILPSVIEMMRAQHPDIALTLEERNPAEQIRGIEHRTLDAGLLRLPVGQTCLNVETILREPLVAALPAGHTLANRKSIRLKELAGSPFILFPRHHGPGIFDITMKACQEAGFSPDVAQSPNDIQSILAFVAGGLGVSLVPRSMGVFHPERIRYLPLRGNPAVTELGLASHREKDQHVIGLFRTICKKAAREITSG